MEIVIEPIHSIININSHSHIKMTPFAAFGDLVYIQKSWWQKIAPCLRIKLIISFGNYYGYAVREDIPKNAMREGDAFAKFLDAYGSIFSINNWVNCFEQYSISLIDQVGIRKLINLKKKILPQDIANNYNPILVSVLNKYLESHKESGIFMRLDKGKIHKKSPKFSLDQIILEIAQNPSATTLFMVPWCYEINQGDEFRVFVYERHVAAISQKECYKYVGITAEKITAISKIIIEYISKLRDKIPYITYVADIWATQNGIRLVKVLPGEPWMTTESCLFNWESDYQKLTQKEKTYVKYIDLQSPMIKPLSGSIESLTLN